MREIIYRQLNKDIAYWTEKRRFGQMRGGNTAGLLTHIKDGRVQQNILIDAGLGTLEAIADYCDDSFWDEPLSVFITHGHIDHHAELMILSEIPCSRRGERRPPVEVYCTDNTYAYLLQTHQYGYTGGSSLKHQSLVAGSPHQHGIFKVTPIPVDHFDGAVIYVIEFEPHKILIGWDMTTLPMGIDLLKEPSLALIEATTWQSHRAPHTSIEDLTSSGFLESLNLTYDPANQQYGAYLLHYSGLEDDWGMLSDADLKARFDTNFPQLAPLVRIAERGQVWRFT